MNNATYYSKPQAPGEPKAPVVQPGKSRKPIIAAVVIVLLAAAAALVWKYQLPSRTSATYSVSGTVRTIGSDGFTMQVPQTASVNGQTFINYEEREVKTSSRTDIQRLVLGQDKKITFVPAEAEDIVFGAKVIVSANGDSQVLEAVKVIISE